MNQFHNFYILHNHEITKHILFKHFQQNTQLVHIAENFFMSEQLWVQWGTYNSASQDFFGKFCLFFCQISAKNCEVWLKIDEIWPNSASQKIPGLLSYTYMTVHDHQRKFEIVIFEIEQTIFCKYDIFVSVSKRFSNFFWVFSFSYPLILSSSLRRVA